MNVLAIGAHYDDLELGCGGTLAKHCINGDNVLGFIATTSGYRSEEGKLVRDDMEAFREGSSAAGIIGYKLIRGSIPTFEIQPDERLQAEILRLIEENNIDTIYTHWTHDAHHDHRNLATATLHSAKHVNRVLMYRSNWYQSDVSFHEDFFVDISDTWELKERALGEYSGEMIRTGNKWMDYFRRCAENAGLQCGVKYAESFQVIRWMW